MHYKKDQRATLYFTMSEIVHGADIGCQCDHIAVIWILISHQKWGKKKSEIHAIQNYDSLSPAFSYEFLFLGQKWGKKNQKFIQIKAVY